MQVMETWTKQPKTIYDHLADTKAALTKNGKLSEFRGLYEGDRRVAARIIETTYGLSWLLSDEEAIRFGRKFVPVITGKSSKIQKQLGLSERQELAPAWATVQGDSNGFTCRIVIFRTDKEAWGLGSVLIREEAVA